MVCKPAEGASPVDDVAGGHFDDLMMTASDALSRLSDSALRTENVHHAEIFTYSSVTELRTLWRALDCDEDSLRLTIVLVLGENFAGFLPGLIRRQHPALRLVIAAPAGRLPGFMDVGDLVYSAAGLGFHMIAVHESAEAAIADGSSPLALKERCVMFVPIQTGSRPLPTSSVPAT